MDPEFEAQRITANAEKAFVSLLKPSYNVQLFANYLKGADGLYDSEFLRYEHDRRADGVQHGAWHVSRRGGRVDWHDQQRSRRHLRGGSTVRFFRSGVNFPSEADKTMTMA